MKALYLLAFATAATLLAAPVLGAELVIALLAVIGIGAIAAAEYGRDLKPLRTTAALAVARRTTNTLRLAA